jgi:hypothetical protein
LLFRRDPHRGVKAELVAELRTQLATAKRHRWRMPGRVTIESVFDQLRAVGLKAIEGDILIALRGVLDVAAGYADPQVTPATIRGTLARCAGAGDALRARRMAVASVGFRAATIPLLMFWETRQLTEQAFGLGSVRTPEPALDSEFARQVLPALRRTGLLTPGERPLSMAASTLAGDSTLWIFSDNSLYVMRREPSSVTGLRYSPDLAVWAEPAAPGSAYVEAEAYEQGRLMARGRFLEPSAEWRNLVAALEVMACQRYVVGITELL